MNKVRLARMKPTAWLINFGRGHLVVDEDLIAAVKAKTIAGAILDVFRTEPLPSEHAFWKAEGIMVLPHIGGGHPTRDRMVAELFTENAKRFLAGEPLKELVDRERGY
jgi:phosphoglycerate dehydrogenase-like enzyme